MIVIAKKFFPIYNNLIRFNKLGGSMDNMRKRLSLFIIFTLLLSLTVPFSAQAIEATSLAYHSIKNTAEGTEFYWSTVSDGSESEAFIMQKNDEEKEIEAELEGTLPLRGKPLVERTYKWIDTEVTEDETNTYTVKLSANKEIKTAAVPVTYKNAGGEVDLPGEAKPLPADPTFVLNARVEGTNIIVSWPVYKSEKPVEYVLYQDGQEMNKYTDAGEHVFEGLEPGTDYHFSMNVVVEGELIDMKSISIKTEEIAKPDFTVFLYPESESAFNATWIYEAADTYNVYLNGELKLEKTKEIDYRFEDLEANTSYEVKVEALDQEGKLLKESLASVKTNASPEGEIVEIKDEYLKMSIKEQLGLRRDITESDMKKLTSLTAYAVEDLSGLEKAENLTRLELVFSNIKDLTVLTELKQLEYLDLTLTDANNYSQLSAVTSLKTLILAGTGVKDLSSFTELTNLELLNLMYTEVENLDSLSSLQRLEELDISYSSVKSIKVLETLKSLKKVILYGPGYFDVMDEIESFKNEKVEFFTDENLDIYLEAIKPIDNGVSLSWEYAGSGKLDHYELTVNNEKQVIQSKKKRMQYKVEGLEPEKTYKFTLEAFNSEKKLIGTTTWFFTTLKAPSGENVAFKDANLEKALKNHFGFDRAIDKNDMEHLTELDLSGQDISNLSGLESAKNLNTLILSSNQIVNIEPLSELTSLHTLALDGNEIADFSPLISLAKLTYLDLSYTGIKDLSVLSGQADVNQLLLSGNGLRDLSDLPKMERLQSLILSENEFTDFEAVKEYRDLAHLIVDSNPIKSLDGIEQFKNISYLDLGMTEISTIDLLKDLEKLQYVNLMEIPTLDLSFESEAREIVRELEARGVYVEYEINLNLYTTIVSESTIGVDWEYMSDKEAAAFQLLTNGEVAEGAESIDPMETNFIIEGLTEETIYEIELRALDAKGKIIDNAITYEKTLPIPTTPKITFKDKALESIIKEQLGLTRQLHEEDMLRVYWLDLMFTDVKDLSDLKFAKELEWLSITENESALDLEPLKELEKLFGISISHSKIEDYGKLKELKHLTNLEIFGNDLTDLSFIKELRNIEFLSLSDNKITDLSVFNDASLNQLFSLILSNNHISNLDGIQGLKDQLMMLDVSRNPVESIADLADFTELTELNLEKTSVEDLEPLLTLSSLEFVYLYGIKGMDFSEGSEAYQIIQRLIENGVIVEYEVTMMPEIYTNDVTQSTIDISWDQMLPGQKGTYIVTLDGEPVTELDGNETSYLIEDLEPETTYFIDITAIYEEEMYNMAYTEITTLPEDEEERVVKEAELFLVDEEWNAVKNAEFELMSTDDDNQDFYSFGASDENGQLSDLTGDEPKGTFELLVGYYELYVVTENDKKYIYEFEIKEDGDYLKEPLVFLVEKDDKQTSPVDPEEPDTDGKTDETKEEPIKPIDLSDKGSKNPLPSTATDSYNLVLLGIILLAAGTATYFIRRRA
ncbi:hypothetical protein CYJ36_11525 [Bacillus sp. UMB0893]|nr:hypothetical protein CYJ36_11525 [Bacillus sp. UMB0893]